MFSRKFWPSQKIKKAATSKVHQFLKNHLKILKEKENLSKILGTQKAPFNKEGISF